MDGVEIRRATAADKDSIMNIAYVSDEDYLKDFFDDVFINCVHTTPYMAVYRGEIIAFIAAVLADDGNTVISRAGRVKPQYSGRGVFKILSQHSLKLSGASVNAFSISSGSTALKSRSFQKENKLILTRLNFRYNFRMGDMDLSADDGGNTKNLEPVTRDLLERFFTSPKVKEYLFLDDRIVIAWVPFKLLPSNIPIIWKREEHSLRISNVHSYDDNVTGLMTMSAAHNGPDGLFVYRLDIFGTDSASIRAHVVAHMNFICERAEGEAALLVETDQEVDASVLQKTLEEFRLQKVKYSGDNLLFEKQIKS